MERRGIGDIQRTEPAFSCRTVTDGKIRACTHKRMKSRHDRYLEELNLMILRNLDMGKQFWVPGIRIRPSPMLGSVMDMHKEHLRPINTSAYYPRGRLINWMAIVFITHGCHYDHGVILENERLVKTEVSPSHSVILASPYNEWILLL